jgi:hypothetical protein
LGGGLGFGDAGWNKRGEAFPVVEEEQLAPIEKEPEVPAALEEVTAPSAEEEAAPTYSVEEAEATHAVGGEVASRRGGLEATTSHGSALREPKVATEATEEEKSAEAISGGGGLAVLYLTVAVSASEIDEKDGMALTVMPGEQESVARVWDAIVAERVSKQELQLIAAGTKVQDVHVVPTKVELVPVEPGDSRQRIRIVVCEGRNREVGELVANARRRRSVGFKVKTVALKDLKRGYVALDLKNDPAKEATNFSAQVIIMNHPE